MSNLTYSLMAIFLAAVLVWQLASDNALGTWWRPRTTRRGSPGVYWVSVVIQGAILVAFLMTGKMWHVR
jgi:hypothetical protein